MKLKYLYFLIFLFICSTIILLLADKSYCQQNKVSRKISITLDYIPKVVKPGDKPISLNEPLLSQLLPELKEPELLSFGDLGDKDEKDNFIEAGRAFVVRGDFDKNGKADLAFVVKNQSNILTGKNVYLVVVSISGQRVTREVFIKLHNNRASLLLGQNYKKGEMPY